MKERIPLGDVIKNIGNYYEAVHVSAKRAKYLYTQDSYTFSTDEKGQQHKKTVVALMEIANGKVCSSRNSQTDNS